MNEIKEKLVINEKDPLLPDDAEQAPPPNVIIDFDEKIDAKTRVINSDRKDRLSTLPGDIINQKIVPYLSTYHNTVSFFRVSNKIRTILEESKKDEKSMGKKIWNANAVEPNCVDKFFVPYNGINLTMESVVRMYSMFGNLGVSFVGGAGIDYGTLPNIGYAGVLGLATALFARANAKIFKCFFREEDQTPFSATTALCISEFFLNWACYLASYSLGSILLPSKNGIPDWSKYDPTSFSVAVVSFAILGFIFPILQPVLFQEAGGYCSEKINNAAKLKTEMALHDLLMEGYSKIEFRGYFPDLREMDYGVEKHILVVKKGDEAGLWKFDGNEYKKVLSKEHFCQDRDKVETMHESLSQELLPQQNEYDLNFADNNGKKFGV